MNYKVGKISHFC